MPEKYDPSANLRDEQRALELNVRAAAPDVPLPGQGNPSSLATILADDQAQWQVSTAGAGGALLVTSDQLSTGGAAVKIESQVASKAAAVLGGAMTEFFNQADGPAPFVAPRVATLTAANGMSGELNQALKQQIQSMEQNAPENRRYILERQQEKLESMGLGGHGVVVMERAPGMQLNKLSADEKVALLKSEAFAQQLGRAMPLAAAIGLDDHLAAKTEDTLCKNNPSNLMYDPASGNLSVIDFSTSGTRISNDSEDLRYTNKSDPGADIRSLQSFLTRATANEEAFEQTLDRLAVADGNDDQILGNFMANYVNGTNGDCMFPQDQYQVAINPALTPNRPDDATLERLKASDAANKAAQARLTPDDKKRFAANVMKGAVEGVAYLQENQVALRNAIESVHEGQGEGAVQHLVTGPQLKKLETELNKVDVPALRQGMETRMAGLDQAPARKLEQVKARAEAVAERIEVLENRVAELEKKTGARLRSKLPGHGGALNKARDELAALKEQQAPLASEVNQALNEVNFAEKLRQQRGQGQAQGQALPQAPVMAVPVRQPSVAERLGIPHGPAPQQAANVEVAQNAPSQVANPAHLERQPSVRSGNVGSLVQQFEGKVADGKKTTVGEKYPQEKPGAEKIDEGPKMKPSGKSHSNHN